MADYVTTQGDMVDQISAREIPDRDVAAVTAEIYDINRHLAALPLVLPAGIPITFPDAREEDTAFQPLRIWG